MPKVGLPPRDMLVPKCHAASGARLIWGTCDISYGDNDIQAWAAAKEHIKVYGPFAAWVCVATRGHMNDQDLGLYLWPDCCPRSMPLLGPDRPE